MHRLGETPENIIVPQVLHKLSLAEQLRWRNGAFSLDLASVMAEQLESSGHDLDFSCTIMVLGKSGVGKGATINSIFDEVKCDRNAFQMGAKRVEEVVGTVQGIKVRVIDTPGLLPSWSDEGQNEKVLLFVERFIKKTLPDIVFYVDRLDMEMSSDFSHDMLLLSTGTEIFGPSIWCKTIVVFTHAASALPDPEDPDHGIASSSYDMFVTQRCHVVQQAILRAAKNNKQLMNPISLVKNNRPAGQRVVLPKP